MAGPITDPETLPLIFDRWRTQHPWLEAFRELESGDLTRETVCRNWRMDHRVSDGREQDMLEAAEFRQDLDGEGWWRRRGEHYHRAICRPTRPNPGGSRSAYLEAPNGANGISRATVPAHEQLIHIASLNRVLWRLTSAEHLTPDLEIRFPDLTGRSFPEHTGGARDRAAFSRQVDDIAAAVNRRGLDAVRQLSGLLGEALGDEQPPWWAGFAQELMPVIEGDDWTAVCQALGMGHLEAEEWLIVWRYETGEVYLQNPEAPLFRPTVIEAGDNPFHFPSPPGYAYGITMPLATGQRGAFREVIHPPLRGQTAIDACRYRLVRIASSPVSDHNQILELRREHRRRLVRDHPQPEPEGWLDRHPPPP